jgi:hypothetical protein
MGQANVPHLAWISKTKYFLVLSNSMLLGGRHAALLVCRTMVAGAIIHCFHSIDDDCMAGPDVLVNLLAIEVKNM